MARYNEGKEHRMAKLKLKIAAVSEAYVSKVYDYVCILCESKTSVWMIMCESYVWTLV